MGECWGKKEKCVGMMEGKRPDLDRYGRRMMGSWAGSDDKRGRLTRVGLG